MSLLSQTQTASCSILLSHDCPDWGFVITNLMEGQAGRELLYYKQHFPGSLEGYPDSNRYLTERLLPYASPGIVLAAITILIGLMFCVCRCCICKCCPNCLSAIGAFFCGVRDVKAGGFTAKDRAVPKYVLIAMFLLTIGGCVVGWYGNKGVGRELDEIAFELEAAIGLLAGRGVFIADTLLSTSIYLDNPDCAASSPMIRKEVTSLKRAIKDARHSFQELNRHRTNFLNYTFIFAIALILLGLLGALCNMSVLAMTMCILAFVCLVSSWICLGLHLGVAVVLDDTCLEIDEFLSNPNERMFPPLQKLVKCPTDATFTTAYQASYAAVETMTETLNNNDHGLPYLNLTTIAPQFADPAYPRSKYKQLKDASSSFQERVTTAQSSLQNFEDTWTGDDVYKTRAKSLLELTTHMKATSNITEIIGFFDSCELVRWTMQKVYDSICSDLLSHFHYVYSAYAAIAVFMIGVIITGSKSSNRFDSDNWEENCGVSAEGIKSEGEGLLSEKNEIGEDHSMTIDKVEDPIKVDKTQDVPGSDASIPHAQMG